MAEVSYAMLDISMSDPEEDEDDMPGDKDSVVVVEGDNDGETCEDEEEISQHDLGERPKAAAPKMTPSVT